MLDDDLKNALISESLNIFYDAGVEFDSDREIKISVKNKGSRLKPCFRVVIDKMFAVKDVYYTLGKLYKHPQICIVPAKTSTGKQTMLIICEWYEDDIEAFIKNNSVNANKSVLSSEIHTKISKLLSLANDKGGSVNECTMALKKAQELMAKYRVDYEDVYGADNSDDEILGCSAFTHSGNDDWKIELARIIARNYCCKLYLNCIKRDTALVFFGHKSCCIVAREAYHYAYTMCYNNIKQIQKEERKLGKTTNGLSRTYGLGFTKGVASELDAQCRALMLVVPNDVIKSFENLSLGGTKYTNTSLSTTINKSVYAKGYYDGRNAMQKTKIETK